MVQGEEYFYLRGQSQSMMSRIFALFCTLPVVLFFTSGCVGVPGGARSAILAGTVAGPAGGAANWIAVVGRYEASEEQRESALTAARMAKRGMSSSSKDTRYISVPVKAKSGTGSGKKAAAQVMVYDSTKDKLASDKVFELKEKPKKDELIEFDTYFTRYTD